MISVRRVVEGELAALREVRLRALAADAAAFGSTLDGERTRSMAFWRERLARGPWFVAWAEQEAVGVVSAVPTPTRAEYRLEAMWVDQAWRGEGVADVLVDAVLAWSRSRGASSVTLWVFDGNPAARRFYERVGFRPVGRREQHPEKAEQVRECLRIQLRSDA
ncbi:GNAT family N-acetyltransferase [Saccharopolyspora shandongensis]|uniref:GNAT family N-acetyltransferase n=1 Tax=Saccharopolyspora shandongensis TaxID=418495 RepID=UPI0015A6DC35|nr:GNAT family N-acetyltransferase [Saccharopolyspora shandongensis]